MTNRVIFVFFKQMCEGNTARSIRMVLAFVASFRESIPEYVVRILS